MGDIFREIDEDLRQERFERLWKRYGKFIVGAAVAVVLIVGGYKAWEHYSLKQKEESSMQYWSAMQLLNDGKKEDAAALFGSLVKNGTSGYRILAKFQKTAMLSEYAINRTRKTSHNLPIVSYSRLYTNRRR